MAPVKRSTTITQRATRSTRGAVAAKQRTTTTETKVASPLTKKPSIDTKVTTAARRGKKQADPLADNEIPMVGDGVNAATGIKSTRNRTATETSTKPDGSETSAVINTRNLAAAPRRRIKITPLDVPGVPIVEEKPKATRNTAKGATSAKKASARKEDAGTKEKDEEQPLVEASKTRSTRKAPTESTTNPDISSEPKPKVRGRPKKVDHTITDSIQETQEQVIPIARTTRSKRTVSTATKLSNPIEASIHANTVKSLVGTRKRVTFQDLPNEDEKENIPLVSSKSKKAATSKQDATSATSATGLRAKPIRKSVSAGITKSKRTTGKTIKSLEKSSDKQEKRMPTALTPKKITQVAKSALPTENEEISDGEDELNGGKTPLRDLSISPRRPPTSALGRSLSPAKKLDFGQSLMAPSTQNMDSQTTSGGMMSPARRPPASPFKDGLKDSPRRGEASRILFPTNNQVQHDSTASIALNPANIASASHTMSTLLQSPKRNGILDAGFFSQSAMKKSVGKSPFKNSLLASPARRLFSPTKKSTTIVPSKISEITLDAENEDSGDDKQTSEDALSTEPEGDFVASSHFRASSSPMRLHKVDLVNDNDNFDFDESVLQVRSPLKVKISPKKKKVDIKHNTEQDAIQDSRLDETKYDTEISQRSSEINDGVNPAELDIVPHPESTLTNENTKQANDEDMEEQTTDDGENMPTPALINRDAQGSLLSSPHLASERTVFTAMRSQEGCDSSEDELAADQTPVRLLMKPRPSLGQSVVSQLHDTAGNQLAFTPLAAQMNGWQASSPEKIVEQPVSHIKTMQRQPSFEFSPHAAQHVDGEVVISRHSTPIQKLNLRKSLNAQSVAGSAATGKKSSGLRKSLAQRQSLLFPTHDTSYIGESPTRDAHFEEYMEMRALDEENENQDLFNISQIGEANRSFDEIMNDTESGSISDDEAGDTVLVNEDIDVEEAGELTTDLVKFTHASDTAMVDFQKLAEEAENMAPACGVDNTTESKSQTLPDIIAIDTSNDVDIDHDQIRAASPTNTRIEEAETHVQAQHEQYVVIEQAASPILQPSTMALESPSMLVIDPASSPSASVDEDEVLPEESVQPCLSTPVTSNLKHNNSRLVKTVVSKVPLKPEGQLSPIKMRRKRARSFGNNDVSSNKRVSFGTLKDFATNGAQKLVQSPDRSVRTSVAPSPGGTSTPASRYSRTSIGGNTDVVTPGQMSFVVDDFGDSTLDGIELPDDYDPTISSRFDAEDATPTSLKHTSRGQISSDTPEAVVAATPLTSNKTSRRATTPATAKKTPAVLSKTPIANSTKQKVERAPLSPVGKGLLDGAVVFVDVYTSEGADASGIFVELLTQMGARCVKEWRWNPRASLPAAREGGFVESTVGITHVIYKDGGKRTLEKVRDAKGQVCCVGVAWVLDCEREGKWLDESIYAIDTAMMPRGGSNRRKSMEPRALLVGENGSVSASKARRSVSAEMNELMKRDLINTPARGQKQQQFPDEAEEEEEDSDDENQNNATPTGYISYDPRTAMTPGTPYLVNQGKKLIQMSAPPKQTGKRLFEDDEDDDNNHHLEDQENDSSIMDKETNKASDGVVKDAKKFRMRNLDMKARRRTLGFKPVVGSPLAK